MLNNSHASDTLIDTIVNICRGQNESECKYNFLTENVR